MLKLSKLREKSVFLLPLLIVLFVSANSFLRWNSMEDNVVDNFIVDVAGRQRMLGKKILSEFILEGQGFKTDLKNSINTFLEQSLALEKGGDIGKFLNSKDNLLLPPAPSNEISTLLAKQRKMMSEFTDAGYRLLKLKSTGPAYQSQMAFVLDLSEQLTVLSNDIVLSYDHYFKKSLEANIYIRNLLSALIISMGIMLAYILYRKDVLTREMQLAKKTALDAVQIKANFFASISHEIRNPLNVIVGIPNILESTVLSIEQRKFVEMLKYTSRHLLTLINDILDFSKIESGNTRLNVEPFNLKIFIEGLVEFNSFKAREKNILVRLNWDQKLTPNIKGDAHRLRQILDNIIGNAIKFTDIGHIDVSIKQIRNGSTGEQEIGFAVSDTGIGISENDQKKIFDTYVQVGHDSAKKRGGSGLGLAISKQLVELMGGAISLKSHPGVGTEISFAIPFELSQETFINTTSTLSQQTITGLADKKLSILIVDDSVDNIIILKSLLESTGRFHLTSAENGHTALELFKTQKFDLVLMDMQMPVLNGTQSAFAMKLWEEKEHLAHTPIVAITASNLDSTPVGFNDYTLKPIDRNTLLSVIDRCLRGRSAKKSTSSPQQKSPYISSHQLPPYP